MIAPWLQHHLEQTGAWDADGISRAAKSRRCPDCRMWVLAGLDDPRCAGPAIVDTSPLSSLGETVALLTGRSTYALRRFHTRIELDHRNQWSIHTPPEHAPYDVIAEHRCRTPMLPTMPSSYHHQPRQEFTHAPPY